MSDRDYMERTKTEDGQTRNRLRRYPRTERRFVRESEVNQSWFERYDSGEPGPSRPPPSDVEGGLGGSRVWMYAVSESESINSEATAGTVEEEEDEEEYLGKGKGKAKAITIPPGKGKGKAAERRREQAAKRVEFAPVSRVREFVVPPSSSGNEVGPPPEQEGEAEAATVDFEDDSGSTGTERVVVRARAAAARAAVASRNAEEFFEAALYRLVDKALDNRVGGRDGEGGGSVDPTLMSGGRGD